MMTVQDIYRFMDEVAPFSAQEKWDNSGLLVGDSERTVERALITLDIDNAACEHAANLNCDLIISHHPVIFSPIRRLSSSDPVYALAAHNIAAICSHTPFDIAQGGINDILVKKLADRIDFTDEIQPLDASGCGRIVTLRQSVPAVEIAKIAKEVLGCAFVRISDTEKSVKTLGICSGSGASMLEDVIGRCDALLTGDVKHDRWYAAKQYGISLIDCGHYHTEVVMVEMLAELLRKQFPNLEVHEWKGGDPVSYV